MSECYGDYFKEIQNKKAGRSLVIVLSFATYLAHRDLYSS